MIALRSFGDKGAVSVERIICNHCGRDLGLTQPLPSALTFCEACHLWVDNQGRPQPRHISELMPKVMAATAKRKKRRAKNEELVSTHF